MALMVVAGVTGCAHPGKGDLAEQGETWQQPMRGSIDQISGCLSDWFNKEDPASIWDLRTPVTTSMPRADGLELVASAPVGMWYWSIQLMDRSDGVLAVAIARRTGGPPSLSKDYMANKVKTALASCGAY